MARVVVTGASGLLGGNLTAELRARGHDVAATSPLEPAISDAITWFQANGML